MPAFSARHLSHCGRPLRPHFLSLGGSEIFLQFSDEKVAVLGLDRDGISLSRRPAGRGTLGLDRKDIGGSMEVDFFCIGFRGSSLSDCGAI